MARNALAKFGLLAVYIEAAKPASSRLGDHWVVQVTSTDGETRLIEVDEADAITAALMAIGEQREARLVEDAANDVRVRNRPSPWSQGP